MSAFGRIADVSSKSPRYADNLIINLPTVPSLQNLISQFLINQQGLDVDFGEHGRTVTVAWDSDQWRNSADCSDTRLQNNHSGPGMAQSGW